MSAFNLAIESGDVAHNEAPLANGEETHTVANAIAEAEGLAQEAADEEAVAEDLNDEQEQTEELAETVETEVAQEGALDPTAARLLHLSFRNIVGKTQAAKKLPATESWAGTRAAARENTRIALEGIKETLKQFWEAIKAQFKKVYAKVKDWITKTFSTAKKLKERAEKLQTRANDTIGTIEDKSFSFGQTKAIAVDGKYNDAGAVTKGLSKVKDEIKTRITELKKGKVDDAIEKAAEDIKKAFSGSGKTRTASADGVKQIFDAVVGFRSGTTAITSGNVGDAKKYADQYGDAAEISVQGVFGLPGGKAIVVVVPNSIGTDLETQSQAIKSIRITMGNDKFNPRDVTEGDVKTLTTSQVDKVCDDVIEIAESIYEYERSWKEREKMVDKVQKEIDDTVRDFDQEDEADSRDQRIFRNFMNGQMNLLRRTVSFQAALCSYGITTANAFLNYGERSVAQHKSK